MRPLSLLRCALFCGTQCLGVCSGLSWTLFEVLTAAYDVHSHAGSQPALECDSSGNIHSAPPQAGGLHSGLSLELCEHRACSQVALKTCLVCCNIGFTLSVKGLKLQARPGLCTGPALANGSSAHSSLKTAAINEAQAMPAGLV